MSLLAALRPGTQGRCSSQQPYQADLPRAPEHSFLPQVQGGMNIPLESVVEALLSADFSRVPVPADFHPPAMAAGEPATYYRSLGASCMRIRVESAGRQAVIASGLTGWCAGINMRAGQKRTYAAGPGAAQSVAAAG